jgi:hypothetical protein
MAAPIARASRGSLDHVSRRLGGLGSRKWKKWNSSNGVPQDADRKHRPSTRLSRLLRYGEGEARNSTSSTSGHRPSAFTAFAAFARTNGWAHVTRSWMTHGCLHRSLARCRLRSGFVMFKSATRRSSTDDEASPKRATGLREAPTIVVGQGEQPGLSTQEQRLWPRQEPNRASTASPRS